MVSNAFYWHQIFTLDSAAVEAQKMLSSHGGSCGDSGIFVRGCPGQSDKKKGLTFFFKSSAYFTEVKWSISKKSIIFKVPEGVQHLPGGSNFFQRGSNCLFPIETHITCDFPGGSNPLYPLWIALEVS